MPEVGSKNGRRRILRPALLDPTSLEARVLDQADACYDAAEAHYGRPFDRPEVYFDIEGRKGGEYRFHLKEDRHQLRFNRVLLHQEKDHYLSQVIAHEVAHHVATILHGPKVGHGPEWQSIMTDVFHKVPDRCHVYDTTATMPEAFVYVCGCDVKHPFSKAKHAKALRGNTYRCRVCKEKLRFAYHHKPDNVSTVQHTIDSPTIPGLYLALDPEWRDAGMFEARLAAVLRGAVPDRIVAFNDPKTHPMLKGWSFRRSTIPTGPITAQQIMGSGRPDLRVSHAVGFTASHSSDVAKAIELLSGQGIKTRLLRI